MNKKKDPDYSESRSHSFHLNLHRNQFGHRFIVCIARGSYIDLQLVCPLFQALLDSDLARLANRDLLITALLFECNSSLRFADLKSCRFPDRLAFLFQLAVPDRWLISLNRQCVGCF